MTPPSLELRGVRAGYGGADVLRDVTLTVAPGEFVAVVGRSGTGKTTLLRVAAGLLEPRAGTAAIAGDAPAQARARKAIGLVFQDAPLHPWRTALENVALPLEVNRRAPGARGDPREWLARVGLGGAADRYPGALSGGMRQRVALARALVLRPEVLLMDEPLGALDELTREEMRAELMELWSATASAVLYVTHDLAEAVLLADRVVVVGGAPARVVGEVAMRLARPRTAATRREPAFLDAVDAVRGLLP